VLLGVVALIAGERGRGLGVFALMALVALGVAHRVPLLHQLASTIPFFALVAPTRFLLVSAFSLAVLGAHGVDLAARVPRSRLAGAAALSTAVLAGLLLNGAALRALSADRSRDEAAGWLVAPRSVVTDPRSLTLSV